MWETLEQPEDCGLALDAGERSANADMRARAEGHVRIALAANVERMRSIELVGIAIGRKQIDRQSVPLVIWTPANGIVPKREARSERDRRLKTKDFLHHPGD